MSSRIGQGSTKQYSDYLTISEESQISWPSKTYINPNDREITLGRTVSEKAIGGIERHRVNGIDITYQRVRDPITGHVTVKVRYKGGTGPNILVKDQSTTKVEGVTGAHVYPPPTPPPMPLHPPAEAKPQSVYRLTLPKDVAPPKPPPTAPAPLVTPPTVQNPAPPPAAASLNPTINMNPRLSNWEKFNWLNSLSRFEDKYLELSKTHMRALWDKKLLLKTVADKVIFDRYKVPDGVQAYDRMSKWGGMVVLDCMRKYDPQPHPEGKMMSHKEWLRSLDDRLDDLAKAAKFGIKTTAPKSSIQKKVREWAESNHPSCQSLPFWDKDSTGKIHTLSIMRDEIQSDVERTSARLERYYRACYRLLAVPGLFDPNEWHLEELSEAASKWADGESGGNLQFETLVAWTRRALAERKAAEDQQAGTGGKESLLSKMARRIGISR